MGVRIMDTDHNILADKNEGTGGTEPSSDWVERTIDMSVYDVSVYAGQTIIIEIYLEDIIGTGALFGDYWIAVDDFEVMVNRKVIIAKQNFDDGNANGWTLNGLWHVTSYRYHSGSYSLAYNKESSHNYDTGCANSGSAEFSLDLTGYTEATLEFYTRWEHESYDFGSYDSMDVDIYYNGAWYNLWHRDCNDGPASCDWWNLVSIDISPYVGGIIKIRFKFDTIDSAYNNYEGWYIDDVTVTGKK